MQPMKVRVKARPSGWMMLDKRMRVQPVMPSGASRWELELYKRGLSESQVLKEPKVMEDWIRRNIGHAFIPESVLEKLGLMSSII